MANKPFFDEFKTASEFSKKFTVNDQVRKYLDEYIVANKIKIPVLSEKDKTELEKRIKTWMARQIWGMPGYYETNNEYDLTVQKALQVN